MPETTSAPRPEPRIAAAAPVPRLVDQHERAPAGLTRFKVRAIGQPQDSPTLYVLAGTVRDAEREYLRARRLDGVEGIQLITRVLPD